MPEKIQAIRGMNDILPDKTAIWHYVERCLFDCLSSYGYQEIRVPVVENTQLFKRTIGEITDIVEKEMYTFNDLNGDSITLRPEATAGCVRACIEHSLLYNQSQKLWYIGPMFRHERPQKGRYRQFTQFGAEVLGVPGVNIELELILLCQRLWQKLGFAEHVTLQINSLGDLHDRKQHKQLLVEYLNANYDQLDEDSKNRLQKNPLRILDSKNPHMQELIANAPKLLDVLSDASKAHFQAVCAGLDALKIAYTINPVLVRGLDYYGHTVFEWVTDKLGSQATICAGGRYDKLVEHLGGAPTSAVGFASGIERLILLMETVNTLQTLEPPLTVFVIVGAEKDVQLALALAEQLHDAKPQMKVLVNTTCGSLKSQFKKADKSGARFALILGENEVNNQQIGVKDLREQKEQITVAQKDLLTVLTD